MATKSKPKSGPYVALDFDSRRLRVACVDYKRRHPHLRSVSTAAAPEALDTGSADAVGAFLAKALRNLGLSNAHVLMAVPRSQAVLKPMVMPPGATAADLPGMVQFQIAKDLPFAAEQAVVDFMVESPAAQPPAAPPRRPWPSRRPPRAAPSRPPRPVRRCRRRPSACR